MAMKPTHGAVDNLSQEKILNVNYSFAANSQPNSDEEEEEDIDYSPEEDEFKKVNICFSIQKTFFFLYFLPFSFSIGQNFGSSKNLF